MKALVLDAENRTANIIQNVDAPEPNASEILVEVKAIALNPIDPLYVAHPLASSERTIGSDFAGIIAKLGPSVPSSSNLKIGDRVAGFLQGACSVNERPGAFAEFLVVEWDLIWKIPEHVATESAAGVSLVALTAAQGMWFRLGLKAPFDYPQTMVFEEHPDWKNGRLKRDEEGTSSFFVYGASTSVGLHAAQMVRLSANTSGGKIRLFGAASKAKWGLLRSRPYEYEHLVDYRDQDWPQQVRKLSGGIGVNYVYDGISEGESVERALSTLGANGKAAIVRSRAGGAWRADNLPTEPVYGAVWEGLGEEIQYQGFVVEKSPAARAFAVEFYKWLGEAVGTTLIPVPVRLMPGGLERVVEDGFTLLGTGAMGARLSRTEEWMRPISAEKLVYTL
ncbi:GroES-like protein [Lophiostoma macrostomum CBS 122681]|uniref:GroES-like protein n=1 Tax=Lophiostoma macrostomum CBS 122681 TaxID=1314788 RepID=A0A6A6TWL4_9PLEO|nr:GroES-like protein [Lophiostoma macrostomum CBS 122681]